MTRHLTSDSRAMALSQPPACRKVALSLDVNLWHDLRYVVKLIRLFLVYCMTYATLLSWFDCVLFMTRRMLCR